MYQLGDYHMGRYEKQGPQPSLAESPGAPPSLYLQYVPPSRSPTCTVGGTRVLFLRDSHAAGVKVEREGAAMVA